MDVKNGMGGIEAREVKYRRTAAVADDKMQAVPLNKNGMNVKIDEKTKAAIEAVLAKDQRVELIPTKDGVRVIHVKRWEVKAK